MRSKKPVFGAMVASLGLLAASTPANAQKAGQNTLTVGWFNIRTNSSSTALSTNVLPVPINEPLGLPNSFTAEGTSLSTSNADTLGMTFSHFFTDNIALMGIAGIPPRFKISGHGELRPPGPAGALSSQNLGDPALNPIIADSRQWSLASVAQYHFFEPTTKLRPFVGLGASYNFFTNIEVNPAFARSVNENMGATLAAAAGKPGPTSVEADADPSWSPVFNIGATYNVSDSWALTASATYIPMTTTSIMRIRAADGTVLAVSKAKIKPKPVIFFAGATYKF